MSAGTGPARIPQRTLRFLAVLILGAALSAGLARVEGVDPASGLTVKAKTLPTTLAITAISACHLFPEGKTSYDYDGQFLDE